MVLLGELDQFRADGALMSLLGSWPFPKELPDPGITRTTTPGLALGLAWEGAVESIQDTPASLQVPLEAAAGPHPAPRAAGGNPGRPSYNAALPVPEGAPSTEKAPRAAAPASPGGTWALPPGTLSSPPGATSRPGSRPAALLLCLQNPQTQWEQRGDCPGPRWGGSDTGGDVTGDVAGDAPCPSLPWHPTCTAKGNAT